MSEDAWILRSSNVAEALKLKETATLSGKAPRS